MNRPIHKLLVANRGVPAVRIMDTCRDRKIKSIAVYSEPDRISHHVYMADFAVPIGEGPPLQSYLKMDRIINAALSGGADAIHPGWGFLSENPDFAQRVADAGIIWIGPSAEVIRLLGDKIEAKYRALHRCPRRWRTRVGQPDKRSSRITVYKLQCFGFSRIDMGYGRIGFLK